METRELKAHVVRGCSCRTSNTTASTDIGALWERAGSTGAISGATAIAVYSDYKLLPDGYEVTVTVGMERASAEGRSTPPAGFVDVDVPAQHCALFETDGSIPQIVAAWEEVWRRWPDGGPRSFAADVEIWHQGPDGKPHAAEVLVGVRG